MNFVVVYPPGLKGRQNVNPSRFVGETKLLGALELGDGLGSFGDGVLGELTREYKADGRLHFPGSEGGFLVVLDESSCLAGDPTESVGDERVQDGHGALGDSCVGVDLLEDAVDVDVVGFASSAFVLLSFATSWSASGHLEFFLVLNLKCS